MKLSTREFEPDDAGSVDGLWGEAFGAFAAAFPGAAGALSGGALVLAQTGAAILVAEDDRGLAGAVRYREEDGIASIDLLASYLPGAGRALVHAAERRAQDHGVRLLRCEVTADDSVLEAYFGRMGYLPVARSATTVALERRLPLLTVREQRREDAAAIAEIAGEDPWPFEQGARPGWFVLADGQRVVGVVSVRERAMGVAAVRTPVLVDGYAGRGLDVWMIERAAIYAGTNGFHTLEVAATPELKAQERDLEERRWFPDGDRFVKRL